LVFPDGIIRKKISLDNIFNEVGVNSKSGLRRQSRLTSSRKPSRGRSRQQPVHVDLARRPDAHLPHWQPSALAICDAPDYIHRNFLAIRRLDEVEIGDRSPLGSPTEFPHLVYYQPSARSFCCLRTRHSCGCQRFRFLDCSESIFRGCAAPALAAVGRLAVNCPEKIGAGWPRAGAA
jgi:hypothetical protein